MGVLTDLVSCVELVLKLKTKSLSHACLAVVLDWLNEACACGGFLRRAQKQQAEMLLINKLH